MDTRLITPRGVPPVPGKAETAEETTKTKESEKGDSYERTDSKE